MNTRPNIRLDRAKQLTTLTERQRKVATLARQGLCNKIIARKLGVTEGTVKIHLYVIFKKLGVRSRAGLIVCLGSSQQMAFKVAINQTIPDNAGPL